MAAGGDIIGSSTHVYQGVPLPRAEEVDPPRGVPPRIPFRTRMFMGRAGKLAELDAALAGPGGAVVQAVHGLGGVGKSTLAAHWAHRHADEHVLTWWITADSVESITAGLADLAGMLVPELARGAPEASAVAVRERAAWARRWLAAHAGWLVVLDNVTDPADVAELVTGAPGGRFLITSRLREGWFDIVPALIELDVLSPDEALALLRGIVTADRPGADLTGGADLCAELGHLPLAVKQAGAYIRQTHLTPAGYLELLRANPAVMYDQAARGGDAERTVARIWRITLDALADTPPAGELLRVMAWWAPQAIPRTLLTPLGGPAEVTTALGALAAYNMITLDGEAVTVHRLVQAVARTSDPEDPHRRCDDIERARRQAVDLLDQARPAGHQDPAQWPAWRILLPHIDALAEHTAPAVPSRSLALLLNDTGLFLAHQGAAHHAIRHLRRALAASQRVLGADHPDTLTSRDNLAGAYRSAGDLRRAIPLFRQTLTDRERVLGTDHPHTLMSRNNLAAAYLSVGNLARAIPLLERTLIDRERLLGGEHPSTLTSRNNLAYAYEAAGDPGRAIPLFRRTLTDRERVLGTDHPDTLASRNNLAGAYVAVGDLGRGIPLYEQALADCERVLGTDHPITKAVRRNLKDSR